MEKTVKIKVWLLLFLGVINLSSFARDFTTLDWRSDTTRLGISFSEAFYLEGSEFPHFWEQFDLGFEYASHTYTVSVEYPEYQVVRIPAGMEDRVKKLPAEILPELDIQSSAHRGMLRVYFIPFIYRDGKLWRLNSFRLVMNKSQAPRSPLVRGISIKATTEEAGTYASQSLLTTGKWVKISVPQTGVFQLTESKLKELGFTDLSKVRIFGYGGALLDENLEGIHPDDLCEVPAYRGNGRLLFYAQGPLSWKASKTHFTRIQNFYSNAGFYFVTEREGIPLAFPVREIAQAPVTTVTTFSERVLHEEDAFNWTASGRELYEGYDYAYGNTKHYSFNLTGIVNEEARITVDFAAASKTSTTVNVTANNQNVGTFTVSSITYDYTNAKTSNYTGIWNTGLAESTFVTLTHNRPEGTSGRLNYLAVNYRRALKLTTNFLSFRDLKTVGSRVRYSVDGCTASTQIWDVTTPGNYAMMRGELKGSTLSFTGDNTELGEYVAVNVNGTFATPSVVGTVPNQNLHGLEKPDLVIVIPSSGKLRPQAEQLAEAHRQKDDMTVHVVTAAQVYNEFSSGTPDATAIRWFMKMFYDRAGSDFGNVYLLMMGDCSYDNRMITDAWKGMNPDHFLLCYQSENSTAERDSYVTDDYLGILKKAPIGKDLYQLAMDIGVGRFPVRNAEEAQAAVDKTIRYMENKEKGPWKNRVLYLSDDEDWRKDATNHPFIEAANGLATTTETLKPELMVSRIFQDAYPRVATASGFTYPQATKNLLSLIDGGVLLLNYTGHGGPNGWSDEFLLTINQIRSMRNACLPLWVTATCDFCRYDDLSYSAGEEAFLNPRGGAVALFTTSRVVFAGPNDKLNEHFNRFIFSAADGNSRRLGDVMRLSKEKYLHKNNLNFSLIGDPALKLAFPDHQVILDSFNGEPVEGADLQMRAGDIITLKGHIEDAAGRVCTDFDGLVYPTVFDRKDTITTYNHIGLNLPKFKYGQYTNKLFAGSDSVKGGYFEITFPVPLDISYSQKEGMINLYAVSSRGEEGNGHFTHFKVGGTAPGATDSDREGPQIWLYLNTPDFQSGGSVNPTPYLYAELTDEEGINATGSGIGHDIQVSIDYSPLYTYVLNDYFQLAPGAYTRGTVQYQFDELPEGDHTLYFTAWDTRNNSSTYQLPFRVEASAAPLIAGLSCYPVPALTDLTFHFSHDRPGTDLTVRIEVFAFSGTPVWSHTMTDQSSVGYYTYTWDLTSAHGQRLPAGVYLYRAHFSTAGSEETTQTLKFVIGTP